MSIIISIVLNLDIDRTQGNSRINKKSCLINLKYKIIELTWQQKRTKTKNLERHRKLSMMTGKHNPWMRDKHKRPITKCTKLRWQSGEHRMEGKKKNTRV